jgi:hypothetical protein
MRKQEPKRGSKTKWRGGRGREGDKRQNRK